MKKQEVISILEKAERNDLINKVKQFLRLKNIRANTGLNYLILNSLDYFIKYPQKFDGATIVKDFIDLEKISLSAMVHDFLYLTELFNAETYNVNKWYKFYRYIYFFKYKHEMDLMYAKNLERLGHGALIPYTRYFGLFWIGTLPYLVYVLIKRLKK